MLPRNQRMELLSKAYVRAIVAQAGGICVEPSPDFGIDFSIHEVSGEHGQFTDEGAVSHLQLKSTTDAAYFPHEDAYHYELDVRTYNHLRKDIANVPRFLVLIVMPKEETLWLSQDHEGMTLRHCAYYHSLKGMPTTANEYSLTITVPRQQVFSIDFLQRQFQRR